VFNCPLSADEIWQFLDLPGVSREAVDPALQRLCAAGWVASRKGVFWIASMPDPVDHWSDLRQRAEAAMPEAIAIGRGLMRLPFVDGVAISGSLSKHSLAEDGDYDFFIITRPGRLWLAYALLRPYRRRLRAPQLLCSNYLLAGHKLALEGRDLFTAIELATLIPVAGQSTLTKLVNSNPWVDRLLPNRPSVAPIADDPPSLQRKLGEWSLAGPLGACLDWLACAAVMNRQRRRSPDSRTPRVRGSIRISRDVAKMHHPTDWKYQAMERYQQNLEQLEIRSGARIARDTAENTVLVASAYYYRLDPKQWQAGKPYPPLGTLYTAGLVRSMGFDTKVFDAGLVAGEEFFLRQLEQQRPAFVVLQEDGFNYLTKMCLGRMRDAALEMVRLARVFGARVAVCSSDATDYPEPYLRAGATLVVRGESEATLADVLQAWRDGRPWADIPGIAFLEADRLVRSPRRAPITDLDQLPAPAWDLIDLAPYRELWLRRHGHFSLNIATTRGCPYSCNWCAKPLYGKRYTVRSPEQVVDELVTLVNHHGAQHFWITDDLFGLKPGWVQRFAGLIRDRGLSLRYAIQTRADLVLRSPEDTRAMAESGLDVAWIGAESGSQRILDAMDKGIKRAQIDQAVHLLRELGVQPALFLQFGYLGETAADIRLTQEMVRELLPSQIGISVSYPLPGTVFHDRVKAQMGSKTHWLHSNDLDMMFAGSFEPAFYRNLHVYTQRRLQVLRCLATLRGQFPPPRRGGRLRTLASLLRALPPLMVARLGMWRAQQAPAPARVKTA
jgi:radical SAM superfamily enzyme YgiQ (UPF0313 family)